MSIPNEALQKVFTAWCCHCTVASYVLITDQLLQEIEAKAILAQRDINVVKQTVSAKQRDARLLELTSSELKSLSAGTNVYEGVGKM